MKHSRGRFFVRAVLLAGVAIGSTAWLAAVAGAAEETAAIEQRLADSARYLASDALEGRGVGTKGLDLAAEYVAAQFTQLGLKTELFDGAPFQGFKVTTAAKIGQNNKLALVGPAAKEGEPPERIELKLREDFTPISISGSGPVDLPLVFVGYGITGKAEKYDDYAGVDVSGKAVVVLRHEPQQDDPHSAFAGTKDSAYAPLRRKVSNAFEHGAAAVIFCTDQVEIEKNVGQTRKKWQEAVDRLAEAEAKFKEVENPSPEQTEEHRKRVEGLARQVDVWAKKLQARQDPVLPFMAAGRGGDGRDFPVIHCRRAALEQIVRAAIKTDLASLEEQIDSGPTPQSRLLTGWRIVGEVDVERTESPVKNVVAVLEGEGPLAEETLVVGAHYDHIGTGGRGSLAPKREGVHNGADDNASGVAAMIEIARTLAARQKKLRRNVVFIAFTAEEMGLLGSSHYLLSPPLPLDKTIAMLNLDMVGRLRDDKLMVGGSGTSGRFGELLDELNRQHGFQLTKTPTGFGPSDHMTFYIRQVPVMHFFTGTHEDYHRPSDDFEKLNIAGIRRVVSLVVDVAVALADADTRPEYVAVAPRRVPPGNGERPFFGSMPDFAHTDPGYGISGVSKGGPAERAGLLAGDVIVRLGTSKIDNLEDFDSALRKHDGGDRVQVAVQRNGHEEVFEVTLDPPR